MNDFIDNIKLIIKTLGYNLFEPISYVLSSDNIEEKPETFICKGGEYEAYGYRVDKGFTVLKGSKIKKEITATTEAVVKRIERLRDKHIDNIKNCILTNNVLFTSPSSASDFVAGVSSSGLEYWKNSEGKTLKQVESELLQ